MLLLFQNVYIIMHVVLFCIETHPTQCLTLHIAAEGLTMHSNFCINHSSHVGLSKSQMNNCQVATFTRPCSNGRGSL